MINIERSDCPDTLKVGSDPESNGEWETKDAIEYYRDATNHRKKYKKTGKEELELSKVILLIKIMM